MAKPQNTPSQGKLIIACDRCGYWNESKLDARLNENSYPLYQRSAHIANAQFEIRLSKGSLFLCSHHYRQHEPYIAVQGYVVKEINK